MNGGERMADNKKYYYLKLKEGFFESDEMLILQKMPDGYLYSDILMKLYLRSLKDEGKLMYRNRIPYSPDVLATVCRHQVGTVEKALEIFENLGLVEILDNGAIYMMDIQNFIGQSSTEADRQREYYNRVKTEKNMLEKAPDNLIDEKKEDIAEVPPGHPAEGEEKAVRNETTVRIFERLLPAYEISALLADKLREWFKYKSERKEPYKEQGMKSLLTQIVKNVDLYGENAVRNLIDECMASNWKGIIWEKLKNGSKYQNNNERIGNRVNEVDNW